MADLLLHGKLPYIGSWDQNFPGVLIVHVVPLIFGLRSQLAFHIWDILLQLAGSYFIFRILARLVGPRAALLGVLLVALYYIQQGLWMAGERDTYVTILMLAVFYRSLTERSSEKFWGFAGIGILIGFTVLLRPTYGLFAVGYVGWLFSARSDWRSKFINASVFSIGVLLPILIVVLIYAISGGLEDLWSATILFNFKVYSGHGEQFSFSDPIRSYLISIPAFALGLWICWQKGWRRFLWLWLILFGGSFASLLILYRHSVYHYHPAMVLFLMMSAIGWNWFAGKLSGSRPIAFNVCFTAIILFFAFQTFRGNTIQLVLRSLLSGGVHSMDEMYTYYEGSSTFGEPVQRSVGEYLKQHASPGEAVQMFGPYSYPQYLSRTVTASRFQTAHAILMRGAGDSLQPFQKQWRTEYLADMIKNKPLYFIVCDAPEAFRQYYGGLLGHEVLAKDFTQLGDWLHDRYHKEAAIGAFTLYRSNP
jgi:MFS family permease